MYFIIYWLSRRISPHLTHHYPCLFSYFVTSLDYPNLFTFTLSSHALELGCYWIIGDPFLLILALVSLTRIFFTRSSKFDTKTLSFGPSVCYFVSAFFIHSSSILCNTFSSFNSFHNILALLVELNDTLFFWNFHYTLPLFLYRTFFEAEEVPKVSFH